MGDEDERRRRLRQQRELVHGSGVPQSVLRAIRPGAAPRAARPRRWSDMGRAEKYALIQSQVLVWALLLVVAYLLATNLGVLVGLAYLVPVVAVFAYGMYRVVRDAREP